MVNNSVHETCANLQRPVFFGMYGDTISELTLYLIETPFNAFANRADLDQAALLRTDWSGSTLLAYENMIYLDHSYTSEK